MITAPAEHDDSDGVVGDGVFDAWVTASNMATVIALRFSNGRA